jgi:hypothetical protein
MEAEGLQDVLQWNRPRKYFNDFEIFSDVACGSFVRSGRSTEECVYVELARETFLEFL